MAMISPSLRDRFKKLQKPNEAGRVHQETEEKPIKKAGSKKTKNKGRDRADCVSIAGEKLEFFIPLPFNPKPKKRPRTSLNMKVLKDAFYSARGDFKKFVSGLHDPETHKSRAQITITPKETTDYEKLLAQSVKKVLGGKLPFHGPVKVELLFVLEGEPTSWPTSPADGDADNLEKAVADALNEVAITDDRFIVITNRYKICRSEPGVLIWLSPAQPEDLENEMVRTWDAWAAQKERA